MQIGGLTSVFDEPTDTGMLTTTLTLVLPWLLTSSPLYGVQDIGGPPATPAPATALPDVGKSAAPASIDKPDYTGAGAGGGTTPSGGGDSNGPAGGGDSNTPSGDAVINLPEIVVPKS